MILNYNCVKFLQEYKIVLLTLTCRYIKSVMLFVIIIWSQQISSIVPKIAENVCRIANKYEIKTIFTLHNSLHSKISCSAKAQMQ